LVGGCAQLPAVTFSSGGDDGGSRPPVSDATILQADSSVPSGSVESGAGSDEAGEDAGEGDSQPTDMDPPDGADAGPTMCGLTTVATCAQCTGAPLRCTKKGERAECVADCTTCEDNWFPCIHCGASGVVRGTCLPVGTDGAVACTTTSLCPCTSPASCPAIEGAAETCDLVSGHLRCLTCGSPGTADASCATAEGGTGVCEIAPHSVPKCE
jgi:hypothetical protein